MPPLVTAERIILPIPVLITVVPSAVVISYGLLSSLNVSKR